MSMLIYFPPAQDLSRMFPQFLQCQAIATAFNEVKVPFIRVP